MSGSSSIPRLNPIAQPSSSVTVGTDATTTTSATSTASPGTGETQIEAGIASLNLARRAGSSFSLTGGMRNPDAADLLARRRPAQSVFGVAGAASRRDPGFRSNPNADTSSMTSGDSETLDPPGHGGHPYANRYDPVDNERGAGTYESKGEREFKGDGDLPQAVKNFMTPTGRRALKQHKPRPPGTDQFGASSSSSQADHLSTASSSSSSNQAQSSQPMGSPRSLEIEQRIKMQSQRQRGLDSDARSTTSSGHTVPGSGQSSASFAATAADSSSRKSAPIKNTVVGPAKPRDDFPWRVEGAANYRLAEFDKWLEIPNARETVIKLFQSQQTLELIEFLALCDECVEAQRRESARALSDEPRVARTPDTYTAMLNLVRSCFTKGGKAEITIHGADVSDLVHAWNSVTPGDDLSWSGPISTAIRAIRSRVITELVIPPINAGTSVGRQTRDDIAAAVHEDDRLRSGANAASVAESAPAGTQVRRPTLMAALRGYKKPPPKPDAAP